MLDYIRSTKPVSQYIARDKQLNSITNITVPTYNFEKKKGKLKSATKISHMHPHFDKSVKFGEMVSTLIVDKYPGVAHT